MKEKTAKQRANEKYRISHKEYYNNYYKDYYKKHGRKNYTKIYKARIDKAIELIKNDYFEDGSGNNIDEVLNILQGECDE